jgi:hypothetical protein
MWIVSLDLLLGDGRKDDLLLATAEKTFQLRRCHRAIEKGDLWI